jgi:hypothetical protein
MEICQIPGGAVAAKSWVDAGAPALLFGAVIALGWLGYWLLKKILDARSAQISDLNKILTEKERLNQELQIKYEAMLREQLTSYGVVMSGYENVIKVLSSLPKELRLEVQPILNDMQEKIMARFATLPENNKNAITPFVINEVAKISQQIKDLK